MLILHKENYIVFRTSLQFIKCVYSQILYVKEDIYYLYLYIVYTHIYNIY